MAECNCSTVKFEITLNDQEVLDLLTALDNEIRDMEMNIVLTTDLGGPIGYMSDRLKATTALRDFFHTMCEEHGI